MKILLGWSKERSQLMARALRDWLPRVLPDASPWMSEIDIDKGKDWNDELHEFLGQATAVIVCITPENVRSPWLYYECGRVSAKLETNLICPYLLGNDHSILSDGPLARFQQTKASKVETHQLLSSLRKNTGEGITDSQLSAAFEREWNDLAGTLARIREIEIQSPSLGESIRTPLDELAGGELTSEARQMILAIGNSKEGTIHEINTSSGHSFMVGRADLNSNESARSTAVWRETRRDLARRQILEMRGTKGQTFALTGKGYKLFDALLEHQTA